MEKTNLIKAILAVMRDVDGIDKTLTVGSGTSKYQGVSDQVVKQVIGDAMQKNGLVIVPISVTPKTQIDRWEEKTDYGMKQKQSVLTEVTTKYLLMHETGESIELAGYGHGVDSQDKSAGKATTYALKYTLLYTFLIPTGKIDDTDNEHSEVKDVPKVYSGSVTPKTAPKSVETPQKVSTAVSMRQKAENDIKNEDDAFGLNNLNTKIQQSKLISDKDKQELSFMIQEKLDNIDPLKN